LERKRSLRVRDELLAIVGERVVEQVRALRDGEDFTRMCTAVEARDIDPWTAADQLLARVPKP